MYDFEKLFLDEERLEFIHQKTLTVLSEKGICFEHEGALEIFRHQGFRVEGNIVYFQNEQVTKAIETTPETFDWQGREKIKKVGNRSELWGTAAGPGQVLKNNRVESGRLEDYRNIAKIAESSEIIDFAHLLMVDIQDIALKERPYVMMANCLKYTTKPINITAIQTENESAKEVGIKQIQMIKDFYGKQDGNVTIGGVAPISPLTYSKHDVEVMLGYLEHQQPVMIMTMSIPLLTSPASLVGTIIQNNAEILAGVVLTQLINPGNPVVYASVSTSINLKEIKLMLGSTETSLLSTATAALAKKYKMPFRCSGSLSDAMEVDYQAGVESSINLISGMLCGVDVMQFSCGSLGTMNISSLEKYVLDEQTVRLMKRFKQGIDIDFSKKYEKEIFKVEHKGSYLTGRTPKEYKKEHCVPDIFVKSDYNTWKEQGGHSLITLASHKVSERLEAYQLPEMTSDQFDVIKDFIN